MFNINSPFLLQRKDRDFEMLCYVYIMLQNDPEHFIVHYLLLCCCFFSSVCLFLILTFCVLECQYYLTLSTHMLYWTSWPDNEGAVAVQLDFNT